MDVDTDFGFDCDSHTINNHTLSYLDSMKGDIPLHFYHANGFPVSVYIPFLRNLSNDFRVLGMGLRGQDGQSESLNSWYQAAEDLISFLDKKNLGPIVGVGHSIGAVATMFAAARRPDLFSKIILIDPVLLPKRYIVAMAFIRIIGRKDLFFLAKRARKRKKSWKDHTEAYEYFKSKSLFKFFRNTFLKSYVTYGLRVLETKGVELLCPPEAEARAFENYPLGVWSWPKKLKIPTLIIRGVHTDVLSKTEFKKFCRLCKPSVTATIENAGHLIPMEQPDKVIELIKSFALNK